MSIHQFIKPIPIVTIEGEEGYMLYVESSGMFENDIFCCVLKDGGKIRHFTSKQIFVEYNATFGIKEQSNA
jgi:hypothetical protein